MKGQGPLKVVEDAVVYGTGNTRTGKAQGQDQLVWAEMVEVA